MDGGSWYCTGDRDQDHLQEKEIQKGKMVVWGGLTNSWEKKRKAKRKGKVKSLSRVQLFATLWTVAHQAPPSMGLSRQEYWSGVPLPSHIVILNLDFPLILYFFLVLFHFAVGWFSFVLCLCSLLLVFVHLLYVLDLWSLCFSSTLIPPYIFLC